MKKEWLVKTLALSVVVLCVTINIQSVFADTNQKSTNDGKNNELVDMTFYLCQSKNLEKNNIKLTQQQVQDFINLFNNFSAYASNAKNLKETQQIYLDMFESLTKIGFLPNDKGVKEIQRMIKRKYIVSNIENFLEKKPNKVEEDNNSWCFINGCTTNTMFINPFAILIRHLSYLFYVISLPFWLFEVIYPVLERLKTMCLNLYDYFNKVYSYKFNNITENIPLHLGCFIGIGGTSPPFWGTGWIITSGLDGKKSWSGGFRGFTEYARNYGGLHDPYRDIDYYLAVMGFTGVGFSLNDNHYFLGYASYAKIQFRPW